MRGVMLRSLGGLVRTAASAGSVRANSFVPAWGLGGLRLMSTERTQVEEVYYKGNFTAEDFKNVSPDIERLFRVESGSQMDKNKMEIDKVIKTMRRHEVDTGSPEVQIGILTKKIAYMHEHLKVHNKDKHSRRGLLGMVHDRRALMSYLKASDYDRYRWVIDTLGLRMLNDPPKYLPSQAHKGKKKRK